MHGIPAKTGYDRIIPVFRQCDGLNPHVFWGGFFDFTMGIRDFLVSLPPVAGKVFFWFCSMLALHGPYLGALLASIYSVFFKARAPLKPLLLLAILPIMIDGGLQFLGVWESFNFLRFMTGIIASGIWSLQILSNI